MKKFATFFLIFFCFAEKNFADEAVQSVSQTSNSSVMMVVLPIIVFAWIVLLAMWKNHRYNVWFEFFVALFMGFLGVQKFREKKTGLGVLYIFTAGGFYIGWIIDVIRYLVAAIKNKPILPIDNTKNQLPALGENEPLPTVIPNGLVLKNDETCYFSQEATQIKIKNVVIGRTSRGGGISTRLMKGVYVHSGGSASTSVRGDVGEENPGIFSITNERVVFSGIKDSFNKKLSEITSVTPFQGGFVLQFDERQFVFQLDNFVFAVSILQRVITENVD